MHLSQDNVHKPGFRSEVVVVVHKTVKLRLSSARLAKTLVEAFITQADQMLLIKPFWKSSPRSHWRHSRPFPLAHLRPASSVGFARGNEF